MPGRVGRPTNTSRRTAQLRRAIGGEIRRTRDDAGLSQARLARLAGISPAHLSGVEGGQSEASLDVLVSIAEALGGSVTIRLHPGTGPRVRDHLQAAIADELVSRVHARWRRFPEVPVYRPVRGVIDLVLHDEAVAQLVAVEIQSELRRLEQVVRWSNEKRDALPSATIWRWAAADAAPKVTGLLVVRNTRANRDTVNDHAALIGAAFPAPARDAVAALTGTAEWRGNAVVWAEVDGAGARILDGPPRTVRLGR
jgi:transcriptional regulator with XRE-family HTH domain